MRQNRPLARTPRRLTAGLFLLGLLVAIPSLAPARPSLTSPKRIQPAEPSILVQFIGHDSKRTREGFVVVRNEKGWKSMWQEHTQRPTAYGAMERHRFPRVNFDTCMVIAYFGGNQTNTDGYIAEDLAEIHSRQPDGPRRLRLRFTDSTFQTMDPAIREVEIEPKSSVLPLDQLLGREGRGGAVDTTPFGIWILPATDKAIVIERGERHLKDEPLTWEEVRTVASDEGA